MLTTYKYEELLSFVQQVFLKMGCSDKHANSEFPLVAAPVWSDTDMTDDVVIRVDELGKKYLIGHAVELGWHFTGI